MNRQHPLEHRIPPPLVAFTVLMLQVAAGRWVHVPMFTTTVTRPDLAAYQIVGIVIGLAGLAIIVAGVLAFRSHATTVNPLDPGKASSMVTGGVFRFTRNPMYLGMALFLLNMAFVTNNALALLGPLLFAAWITRFQIIPEERALDKLFGAEFGDYCARTRRWI